MTKKIDIQKKELKNAVEQEERKTDRFKIRMDELDQLLQQSNKKETEYDTGRTEDSHNGNDH